MIYMAYYARPFEDMLDSVRKTVRRPSPSSRDTLIPAFDFVEGRSA